MRGSKRLAPGAQDEAIGPVYQHDMLPAVRGIEWILGRP